MMRTRFARLAAAVGLGLLPQAYSESQSTNQGSVHTTSQTSRVPLDDEHSWRALKYDNRPAHLLRFTVSGLDISVRRSAMPLFHLLPRPVRLTAIRVHGRIAGGFNIPSGKQGEKDFDDCSLRVGLVEPGSKTLTARERRAAADWVKALFDLAPAGRGISNVHFLNLGVDSSGIGRTRRHPMSKLLEEEVVAAPRSDGRFEFARHFNPPTEVCAIWISADGDDTKSSFQTVINQIEIETLSQ